MNEAEYFKERLDDQIDWHDHTNIWNTACVRKGVKKRCQDEFLDIGKDVRMNFLTLPAAKQDGSTTCCSH